MCQISVQNKIFVAAKTPQNPQKFEPHENYYPYGMQSLTSYSLRCIVVFFAQITSVAALLIYTKYTSVRENLYWIL